MPRESEYNIPSSSLKKWWHNTNLHIISWSGSHDNVQFSMQDEVNIYGRQAVAGVGRGLTAAVAGLGKTVIGTVSYAMATTALVVVTATATACMLVCDDDSSISRKDFSRENMKECDESFTNGRCGALLSGSANMATQGIKNIVNGLKLTATSAASLVTTPVSALYYKHWQQRDLSDVLITQAMQPDRVTTPAVSVCINEESLHTPLIQNMDQTVAHAPNISADRSYAPPVPKYNSGYTVAANHRTLSNIVSL